MRPHHSQSIYNAYKGDKNLVTFDGDHNELRPAFFLDSAAIFLTETLRIPDSLALQQTADPVTGRPMNLLDSWARAARGGFGGGSRGALADYDSFGGGGGGGGRRELEAALGMAEMEAEMLRAAIAASLADGAAAPANDDTAATAPEPEHAEALSPPPAPRGAAAASGAALVRDLLHGTGADSAARAAPTANGDAAAAPDVVVEAVEVAAPAAPEPEPPPTTHREEDEELARAIELSLQAST